MQDRLAKEKAFHNDAFSTGIRNSLDSYYSIFGSIRHDFSEKLKEYAFSKDVMECGCGVNSYAKTVAPLVNRLHGIDISDEAVRQSGEMAAKERLNNCLFTVMNAETLDFGDESFDLIFGVGIIHHLELQVFYKEAARVLKEEGRMLFMEPLGYNPFINLYRKLTPKLRTPDEHPLLKKDLALIRTYFDDLRVKYYHFFTLLAIPFRKTRLFQPLLNVLGTIDHFFFKYIPGFRYLAWYVIIDAGKNQK